MITTEQRQSIKAVPITSYLAGKGILPVAETGGEYCYFSPFREEKTPSFFVNTAKNVFIDFNDGKGGDSLALVMKLDQVDFIGAVRTLQSVDQSLEVELQSDLPASPQRQSFIKRITPITHNALKSYLTHTRHIPLEVASKELSEVHYRTSKGEFFSLGFKNESDGWELRNPSFKGCIGQKDISIRGNRSAPWAVVFEGFMDYLSWFTLNRQAHLKNKGLYCFYILNSLSLVSRLPDLERFEMISLFLDNDEAGQNAALKVAEKYEHAHNASRQFFPNSKDLNDFIRV